jgi:protein-serine/threonine kinase
LHEEDAQDQIIGSSGSTPTGVTTPQPDPADKRLPSIMHYFSQVGNPAFPLSSFKARSSASLTPAAVDGVQASFRGDSHDNKTTSGDASPISGTNTPAEHERPLDATVPARPCGEKPDKEEPLENVNPSSLPTPPYSSSCSLSQKEAGDVENETPGTDKNVVSIYSALKSYLSSSSSSASSNAPDAPSSRRPTSHPVSSVSDDPVLASHFSNPSLPDASDLPSPPAVPLLDHEKPYHISKSSENLAKLTESAAHASRFKNTPPLTPRAMSSENASSANGSTSAPPGPPKPRQSLPTSAPSEELASKLNEVFPSAEEADQEGPTLASLKGKLSVKIDQARGLRPSIDPYVVCVFEWNEYISKGAQSGEHTPDGKRSRKEWLENDTRRPMAIPMKSRQSSHNSQLDPVDPTGKTPVTDPQWNHEAVLYVCER